MQHLSDFELVILYRSDKESQKGQDAATEIYKRFWKPVLHTLTKRLHSRDTATAEDLTQQGFINFFKWVDNYDESYGSVHGFILYLANKRLADEFRRGDFRPVPFASLAPATSRLLNGGDREGDDGYHEVLPIADQNDGGQYDPPTLLMNGEIIQRFWDFANKLDKLGRDILVMSCAHNQPRNTVAYHLGVNRNTVARQLRALLPRLRSYLGPYGGDIKSICFERREYLREEEIISRNVSAA